MPKVTAEYLEARKNQILEAARACFCRRGFHQTTMQDICCESGLSPGAIYRYFRSKEDIVQNISDQARAQEVALIRQVRKRLSAPEVLDTLTQHFFGMLTSMGDGAPVDLEIWTESYRNARLHKNLWRNYQEYLKAIAGIIRQGIAEGKFNPKIDPKAAAQVMIALYEGTVMQKTLFPDEVDIQKLLQAVHSLVTGEFWRGSNSNHPTYSLDSSKVEG